MRGDGVAILVPSGILTRYGQLTRYGHVKIDFAGPTWFCHPVALLLIHDTDTGARVGSFSPIQYATNFLQNWHAEIRR